MPGRHGKTPTPEERREAVDAALHWHTSAAKKVLAAVVADATGQDPVIRFKAQELFVHSWLAGLDRSELMRGLRELEERLHQPPEELYHDHPPEPPQPPQP
jgi:hypothetical protein